MMVHKIFKQNIQTKKKTILLTVGFTITMFWSYGFKVEKLLANGFLIHLLRPEESMCSFVKLSNSCFEL